jgi:hypothetical protein
MNELGLNIDFNLSQSLDKTIRWQLMKDKFQELTRGCNGAGKST